MRFTPTDLARAKSGTKLGANSWVKSGAELFLICSFRFLFDFPSYLTSPVTT